MSQNSRRSLAGSARAIAWLGNFQEHERPTARLLLESVTVVSESAFLAEMKEQLKDVASTLSAEKVAVYPVQDIPKSLRNGGYFNSPNQLKQSGSELIIQNLVNKTKRATRFVPALSLSELRDKRADVILLVTDMVASGDEVTAFLDFMYRNPSICSWHSSKHVRFEVATHTIADAGWALLSKDKRVHRIHSLNVDHGFDRAAWTPQQRTEIEALCAKYSDSVDGAFGWKGARSLLVFEHTFGNGVPRVLLRTDRGRPSEPWVPFLPHDRAYGLAAEDALASSGYHAPFSVAAALDRLAELGKARKLQKQERAALRSKSSRLEKPLIELLIAMRVGEPSDHQIMQRANMTSKRLLLVRATAEELGLITARGEITPAGKRFLRRKGQGNSAKHSRRDLAPADSYYPQQLRRGD